MIHPMSRASKLLVLETWDLLSRVPGIKDLSSALINALKAHLVITDKMTSLNFIILSEKPFQIHQDSDQIAYYLIDFI